LAEGSLDRVAFRRYVAQDAFYLKAFFKAYALAAAKCDQLQHMARFQRLMGGVLEELELHRAYAASLNIDLSHVQPLPATRAYTDFLLHTAWGAGVDEILAAMVPCMRLYAWLGQTLAPHNYEGHPYGHWLTTYASPAFAVLAVEIESLLDELARDGPAVREAYRYAMRCERDFFAAPMQTTATDL
jgi:thiaminase/transcriptional activator TenA